MHLGRISGFLVLAALCGAATAKADDTNFRPYLLGGRAAGMGGAFTAIADDGSGGYYNPGGLAFADRSSLSLSASVYGEVTGSYDSVLAPGQAFTYHDLNVFPVSTSAVRKFGPVDPKTGVGRDTFVVSVFVPDAIHHDDRDFLFGNTQKENVVGLSQEAQTLWIGGGYARRFGRIGLGAMGYVLLGSSTTQLDLNLLSPTDSAEYAILSTRQDQSTIGFVGSVGARIELDAHWHLGLSLFSPEVGFGSRESFVRVAVSDPENGNGSQMEAVQRDDLSAKPALPLRAQLGTAWTQGPLTLAADLIFLAGRTVDANEDLASQGLNQHVVRTPVFDVSVGGEYVLDQKYPLRAGFFTDLPGTKSPDEFPGGIADTSNTTHVARYGLSFSGGIKSEHVVTDLGVNVSYGTGEEFVPANLDFANPRFTPHHELNAYVFLATSYEF